MTAQTLPRAGAADSAVGVGGTHVLIIGRCGEMPTALWSAVAGMTTSVLTTPDELPNLIGVGEHEVVSVLDLASPHETWIRMAHAVDAVRQITAVVAFADEWMYIAAAVREALGLPGTSWETVRLAYEKNEWRTRLREREVEDIGSEVVASPSDIVAFANRREWPVVVKPVRGGGSAGVTLLGSGAGAAEAWQIAHERGMSDDGPVLVEIYMAGQHLDVGAFAEAGEIVIVSKVDIQFRPPGMAYMSYRAPVQLTPETERTVDEHVLAALRAIGLRDGPATVEVRLTDAGPRTIECQLRLDGGAIPWVLHKLSGLDLATLWARQLAGVKVMPKLRRALNRPMPANIAIACWVAAPNTSGELVSIDGIEDALATPGVIEHRILRPPGSPVGPLRSASDMALALFCEGATADQVSAIGRQAIRKISFTVRTAGINGTTA